MSNAVQSREPACPTLRTRRFSQRGKSNKSARSFDRIAAPGVQILAHGDFGEKQYKFTIQEKKTSQRAMRRFKVERGAISQAAGHPTLRMQFP